MKWYNTDKTKMINLNSVNGFVFIKAKEYIEQNPINDDVEDFKLYGDRIELIIGGAVFVFRGDTANELYDALTSYDEKTKEQLLKG
jgi:hypothetical protein